LSYVEVAHSDALARRVVKRLGLSESPRDLAAKVSASTLSNTVILDISVFDPSPDRAQLLANAVAKELGRFGTELETPPGEPRSNVKVTIIDDAAKPTSPADAPQHDRNVALGLMLGFLLGFGIAVVRESTRSKGDTA
jgi:receptor protein-tyrosine kinase